MIMLFHSEVAYLKLANCGIRLTLFIIFNCVVFSSIPNPSTPPPQTPFPVPFSPTPHQKKTKPGLSSRISSQDQSEISFLPLIRNARLLPTLSLASVSPWYVPQYNPLVSLRFPPTMGLSRCLLKFIIHHTASLITNLRSSKFSGGNKRGQGKGRVPFLWLAEKGEGAVVLQLSSAPEPRWLRGPRRVGGTRWGGSGERVGLSWNENFTHQILEAPSVLFPLPV